jgi:hypothetical protein
MGTLLISAEHRNEYRNGDTAHFRANFSVYSGEHRNGDTAHFRAIFSVYSCGP